MGYDLRTDTDLQAEAKRRLFKEASKRGVTALYDMKAYEKSES